MFGDQDRLEVAIAITSVETGKVNPTDLHREIDVAVNRIRSQLLAMVELQLLRKVGIENGKRIFETRDPEDLFWKFAVHEFDTVLRHTFEDPADVTAATEPRERIR